MKPARAYILLTAFAIAYVAATFAIFNVSGPVIGDVCEFDRASYWQCDYEAPLRALWSFAASPFNLVATLLLAVAWATGSVALAVIWLRGMRDKRS